MTGPRSEHAAILLPSGKVLVVGGVSPGNEVLATAELYDPTTGTWSPTGSMSVARAGHTLTLLPTGKALVVGGTQISLIPNLEANAPLASAELYDPQTGQWTTTAALPASEARAQHTATLLGTGEVLVAGGDATLPPDCFGLPAGKICGVALSTAFLYDPASGEWRTTGNLTDRTAHTATLLASGAVLVAGGLTGSMGTIAGGDARYIPNPTVGVETYEPASGTWTKPEGLHLARWDHTATLLSSGDVLVAGGGSAGTRLPVPVLPRVERGRALRSRHGDLASDRLSLHGAFQAHRDAALFGQSPGRRWKRRIRHPDLREELGAVRPGIGDLE
jgi:hypothetical protein